MNKTTPEEIKDRKRRINIFDKNWYVDDYKNLIIKHKKPTGLSKVLSFFWRRKYLVDTLYWWSAWKWTSVELRVFTLPVKHDDLPIKGFPRKHQMAGGWTIATEDLKYLKNGPLFDHAGEECLVKHQSTLGSIVIFFKQIKPLSYIVSTAVILFRYRNEVKEIVDKLISAL